MRFDYCIGNPPYQQGREQVYTLFFQTAKCVADTVEMIFPTGWQEPKSENGLSRMNNIETKQDEQLVFIRNEEDVFKGVAGAKYTNIVLWKKGYNNGLSGKQKIIQPDGSKEIRELLIDKSQIQKPSKIISICDKVALHNEPKIIDLISASKPYGFRADPLDNPDKYNLTLSVSPFTNSVRLFGRMKCVGRTSRYIDETLLPKKSQLLNSYKLFLVKAWGNMDEKQGYLGGSYAQLLVASPKDCCSEMYIEVGPFNTKQIAENAKKYFNTKFFRAVFYKNKFSQNTAKATYADVPLQDFTEHSDIDWTKSIPEIDQQLYAKYNLSDDEIQFIETHVKEMN